MKKRIVAIALMIVLVMALASFAHAETQQEFMTFTHPTYGYSIDYPVTWLAMSKDMEIDVSDFDDESGDIDIEALEGYLAMIENTDMFMARALNGTNVNVTVEELTAPITTEAYIAVSAKQMVGMLDQVFADAEAIDSGSMYTAGDVEAVSVVVNYTVMGRKVQMQQFAIITESNIYSVTFTFFDRDELESEDMQALVDTILASFTI